MYFQKSKKGSITHSLLILFVFRYLPFFHLCLFCWVFIYSKSNETYLVHFPYTYIHAETSWAYSYPVSGLSIPNLNTKQWLKNIGTIDLDWSRCISIQSLVWSWSPGAHEYHIGVNQDISGCWSVLVPVYF